MGKRSMLRSEDRPPAVECHDGRQRPLGAARVQFEEGWFWAEVPALPGCFASGRTTEELAEALAESIGMCLAADDAPLPSVSVSPSDGWQIAVGGS